MSELKPRTAPELDLSRDLQNFGDVLPISRLRNLESLAQADQLTDSALMRELGRRGVALTALCLARPEGTSQTDAPEYQKQINAVRAHLLANAPSLLEDSRLLSIAQRVLESGEDPKSSVYREIGGVRSTPLYVGYQRGLLPLVRTEILDDEDDVVTSFVVKLNDHAFLCAAFLAILGRAIDDAVPLTRKGAIEREELDSLQQKIKEIETRASQISKQLDRPTINATAATTP